MMLGPKSSSDEPAMGIAVVCENASLKMGGEAAIPLRFFKAFRALGQHTRLLTHSRNRDELTALLDREELRHVVFFEDTTMQKFIFKVGRKLPSRLQEIFIFGLIAAITETLQVRYLRNLARMNEIDVVFQPVPISPKALSLIDVSNAPVFFGPLNGAMDYPPAFRNGSNRISDSIVHLGRLLCEPLHYVFPAKRRSSGIFLANPRTLRALPRAARLVSTYKSFDATIDGPHWKEVRRDGDIETDHFLYVGRLVDWKAVRYAIAATHALEGRARLTIVGDGPEKDALISLAASGPARIDFRGYLSHDALRGLYQSVCAQLLPSLREAGGNVCMEALAAGVPVIATRWGGAVDVVNDGVDGILVEPTGENELINGFAAAMRRMMDDPQAALAMGARGRARVLDAFDWTMKARDFLEVFRRSISTTVPHIADRTCQDVHPIHAEQPHANRAWLSY